MNEWLILLETVGKSWRGLGSPHRVTAAVSGGADSVALLAALKALAEEEGMVLSAAHVDHGLRETSGRDAAFVEKLCADWGIPCKVVRAQVNGKSENAARQARYEALRNACLENETAVLALAHHKRDQAETVLLHLLRGSGSGGLSAMQEKSWRSWPESEGWLLWRPMLGLDPELIRAALKEKGIPWMEDETNEGDAYQRKYIRHQVLPVMAARFPKAEDAICRAARILADEDAYFRSETERFLEAEGNACLHGPCRWIRLSPLLGLHKALRRYVLKAACPTDLDADTVERLLSLSPGQKMNLPENGRAECSGAYLHFLTAEDQGLPPVPLAPGILVSQPWGGETGDGFRAQAIREDVYAQCELRRLAPGDTIRPLGSPGAKSMQDYFVDKKVPRPFRPHIPLLCMGKRVVWAIGVGAGEEARVKAGDRALLLRYEGYLPGEPDA